MKQYAASVRVKIPLPPTSLFIVRALYEERFHVNITESEDSVKNPYMQDFIMKNPIFHTQDLCLCTLDANLICEIYYISHYAKNVCRNGDYYERQNF